MTLRTQILDLLSEVQQHNGMSMLLITHDLNLVRKFADRVAVMENGHLVEQGTVAEVFANPQHRLHPQAHRQPAGARRRGSAGASPQAPVMRASGLQVSYPIPCPACGLVPQGQVRGREGRRFSPSPRAAPWAWWANRARASPPWRWRRSA